MKGTTKIVFEAWFSSDSIQFPSLKNKNIRKMLGAMFWAMCDLICTSKQPCKVFIINLVLQNRKLGVRIVFPHLYKMTESAFWISVGLAQ